MKRKDLQNIESLLMLSTLDECQSKRKAAETLGASVDTLNKYINNLEAELGLKLVISSEQGCRLTSKGIKILNHISPLKDILMNVYNESERYTQHPTVQIGMDAASSPDFMLYGIDSFFNKHPDIRISTTIFPDQLQILYNGLDIGISCFPPQEKETIILATKKLICKPFASRLYLEQHGYPKSFDDLIQNHRIVCKTDQTYYDTKCRHILQDCSNICYISNSNVAIINAVRHNAGICMMPVCCAEDGLICLTDFEWNSNLTVYLFSHKQVKDLPCVRTVIDYFKERFNQL